MKRLLSCSFCAKSHTVEHPAGMRFGLLFCDADCRDSYAANKPSKREYGSYSCRCCGYQTNNHAALQEHIKQSPRGCSEAYT